MTLQNRVLPTGEITAAPFRGTLMGNRGILHDGQRRLGTRRWSHHAWVTCLLEFKNRHRTPMTPGAYTELFFLDEAVALAAGHRPCGECRRTDFSRFKALFIAANDTRSLTEIDRLLQRDRISRARQQIRHRAPARTLPDGTFILHNDQPHMAWQGQLLRYTPKGYDMARPRPASGDITVLTPACTIAVLAQGYRPALHSSAQDMINIA